MFDTSWRMKIIEQMISEEDMLETARSPLWLSSFDVSSWR